MARKVIDIIYNLVRKRMTLKGDGTGITSLPRPDQVERGMQNVFKRLKEGGYNVVSADKVIKNEDDLARILEEINQKQIADAAARQKAAEGIERIFDKMRRNIPLNPDDQAALQGSGFKTALDNFKGFEPKVIPGGKSKKPRDKKSKGGVINAIKNLLKKSKPKKSGDKIYGVGGEEIDVADLKKSLGLDEATDKKSMEDLEKKLQMIIGRDRTKHAKGGLAGALAKLKKKFGKDIIQKGKAPKDKGGRKKLKQMFEDFNKRTKKEKGGISDVNIPMTREPGKFEEDKNFEDFLFRKPLIVNPESKLEDVMKPLQSEENLSGNFGILSENADISREIERKIIEKENEYMKRTGKVPPEFFGDKLRIQLQEEFLRQNKAGGGLAYMLGEPRENFADGGMSRRTFLKIMAALAAFPVVGKLTKTAKVAKGTAPLVTKTSEMPEHFPKLVEKILREGTVVDNQFVKKTGNVKTYRHPDRPDMELTIEGEGDRITLDFETDQGMRGGYEFKKGVPDETVRKPPDEFIEGEVKYKMSPEGDYTKDFEEVIDTGTENLDEFVGIKKQKTSKSKVILNDEGEAVVRMDDDFAEGGLAGLLGE